MTDPRQEVENRRGWRLTFLHSLYEWSDGNPAVTLRSIWSIGDELGIPSEQVFDVVSYLSQEGLAEQCDSQGGISITHAGVKEVEAALSAPSDPTPRFPPARNVIRIEHAVNAVIQQGNVGSTQTVRVDAATENEAASLADVVEAAMTRLDVAQGDRDELRAELAALQAQLASPRPRLAAVREAATGIRDVLESLARSGKAARDALPLLERTRALLGRMRT